MALIEIGSQKQLFVDNYLIESMSDCKQVVNPAAKVPNNPVISPEHPWELSDVGMNEVWFDEKDQVFKMWYTGKTFTAGRDRDEVTIDGEHDSTPGTCLAISDDGVNWEKPSLGLVEYQGSKDNNILPLETYLPGGEENSPTDRRNFKFIQDLHDEDESRRFKGMLTIGTTKTPGMQKYLYYSSDAMSWTPYENNPVVDTTPRIGIWGPTEWMGWDPIREVYAVHMENCLHRRAPLGKRLIGRAESPDYISWSDPETIILPDEIDSPDTEFYDMPTIEYEGLYVGMLWIFRTTNITHHPTVVFSRDGVHYERNIRDPFIMLGRTSDFDSTSIYAQAPIVHGDTIYTYYTGRNWRSPERLLEMDNKGKGAVGLATSRLDGFVSVDGAKGLATDAAPLNPDVTDYSQLVTRSFGFTGSSLHLNVMRAPKLWGAGPTHMRVQLLTANHEPIPGYAFDDCDPMIESGLDNEVTWKGSSDVSGFEGQPIKLRFYFKNVKLYSYQFK